METFRLTQRQEIELRIAHRTTKNKRKAYRINALLLLGLGWTYAEVSEALLLNRDTLRDYITRYKSGGLKALLKDKHQGSSGKLSGREIKELCVHLEEKLYSKAEDIAAYVLKTYKVKYSVSGITDLLKREGFVHKKTKIIPGKADAKKQEAFIETYEQIKADKDEKDPIYFSDGVHPTHNTQSHYAWIRKGKEKEIKSNTGRQRLNINGAINIETKQPVVRFDKTLNAQSTIKLLKKVERRHPKATVIHFIVDNARYYKCTLVKEYLESSKINMIFLPPYSPNLNLIERLWKYFRKKVTKGHYYETFDEFKIACERFFKDWKKHKRDLESLLTENFHVMSAK